MIVGQNHHIVSTIATAGVLFTFCSDELADFERDLVASVCRRFIEDGPGTVITAPEWTVFTAATKAMATRAAPGWMAEYRYGRDGAACASVAPLVLP